MQVINHLDKLFITSDASTILRELEVRTDNSQISTPHDARQPVMSCVTDTGSHRLVL